MVGRRPETALVGVTTARGLDVGGRGNDDPPMTVVQQAVQGGKVPSPAAHQKDE